jgi:Trk-type K+ transport system membrane component
MKPVGEKVNQKRRLDATIVRSGAKWYSSLNFYRCYTIWILFWSCFGGLLIKLTNKIKYIDGLFLAISAVTSTGLSPVSMLDLKSETFVILLLLILVGSSLILPLGPMIYRRYQYSKFKQLVPKDIIIQDNPVISEFDLQDRALGVMLRTMIYYVVLWMLLGGALLWATLYLHENEPELEERGYSRFNSAFFLSVSAFNNAGFSLSSDSTGYLANNPLAYLILSLLIIAGNTMAPVFYRIIIYAEWRLRIRFKMSTAEHRFILDNPRRISVNTLPTREVIFLLITTTALNIIQYIFYLGSVLGNEELVDIHGDKLTLAGIGFFQTISTRNAGLQMMSLRTMNQGMLLVYAIAMYLSGAPFLTALYASEDSQDNEAKNTTQDSDSDTDSDSDYDFYYESSDDEETEVIREMLHEAEEEQGDKDSVYSDDSDNDKKNTVHSQVDTNTSKITSETDCAQIESLESIDHDGVNSRQRRVSDKRSSTTSEEISGAEGATLTSQHVLTGNTPRKKPSFRRGATTSFLRADEKERRRSGRDSDSTATGSAKHKVRRNSSGSLASLEKNGKSLSGNHLVKRQGISSKKPKGTALLRQIIKESLFLAPTHSDSTDHHVLGDEVSEQYVRNMIMNGDDHESVTSIATAASSTECTDTMLTTTTSSTDAAALTLRRKSGFSSDLEYLQPSGRRASGASDPSGISYRGHGGRRLSTSQFLTQQMRMSLADISASVMLPSPNSPLQQQHTINRSSRQNSVEVLNQRKFEIQQKFMDTFIFKHSFFIGVGVFICAFSEDDFMRRFPENINLWYIIFEVVSAYGNVGLSISEPGIAHSLVGSFGLIGKLTICAIMLLGKHRTQPKERDAVIDFKFKRLKRALNDIAIKKREAAREAKSPVIERNKGFTNNAKVVPLPSSLVSSTQDQSKEGSIVPGRRISFSDDPIPNNNSASFSLGIVRRD